MKKRNVIISIVVVVALIALIAFKLTVNKKKLDVLNKPVKEVNTNIAVTTAEVGSQAIVNNLVKTGTLLPYEEADIMATSAGKVTQLNIALGTHVSEGQAVGQIDSRLKELALQKAELALSKLKTDYDRYTALFEGNATTETSVSDLKFNYEDTKNQVEQLRKQLADATIISPVSGIITKKNIEKGEYVNVGTQVGTVVDISRLKVQVMLGNDEIGQVKLNQQVKLTITTERNPMTATVTYISPRGDDAHNYLVELTLGNGGQNPIKAGGIAYVDFTRSTQEAAMQIPRSSLLESVKDPYVYVVENGRAIRRKIAVGRELGDNIELLGGLKAGEVVVTSGQINLSDSAVVSIVKNN